MNGRIYKFRAWDKHSKKMYSPEEIESIPNYSEEFERTIALTNNGQFHHLGWHYARPESCIELMQFTELKDRNGKEIFEGDIVSCHCWNDFYNLNTKEDGKRQLIKVTMQFSTSIDANCQGGPDGCEYFDDVEIIGNIFENPELIKE